MPLAFRRHFASISLIALVACTPAATAPGALRNPDVAISSMIGFDSVRMRGLWHEVAGFAQRPGCRPGTVGLTIEITGSDCFLPVPKRGAALKQSGPGRLTIAGGPELWVLWVDADYRTMVIGDPAGRFGVILNRDVTIAADRLEAARRVLAFNGYDISRLQMR